MTSAWPIQNFHGFSAQQVLGIRSVRRAWLHRAWTWLVLQRVVVKVWHSLSVKDLVEIPPSGHVCPGPWPMAICKYGKGTLAHDGSVCVGMSPLDTGRFMGWGCLKGRFWRPQGSPYRAYLGRIPRTYCPSEDIKDSINGCSFYTLLHAIVEHRSYLLWLSRGITAIQTPRAVGIYGPQFHNYWLDYHGTWQKWNKGVNFEM